MGIVSLFYRILLTIRALRHIVSLKLSCFLAESRRGSELLIELLSARRCSFIKLALNSDTGDHAGLICVVALTILSCPALIGPSHPIEMLYRESRRKSHHIDDCGNPLRSSKLSACSPSNDEHRCQFTLTVLKPKMALTEETVASFLFDWIL